MDAEKGWNPYEVKGFPTIKLFATNKKSPIDYQGERTAKGISDYMATQIGKLINKRVSSGGQAPPSPAPATGGNNKAEEPKQEKKQETKKEKPKVYSDNDVIVLDDSNFDSVLMKSKDMWMVEFYAPWCGHCKNLEPHWNQLVCV